MRHLPLLLAATAASMIPAMALAQVQQTSGAQISARTPLLSLSVTESVNSAPDMATINTGVQTRALTAQEAMTQNAAQMNRLIAALLKAGIERKDIQTSGINLSPRYDYNNRTEEQGPRFIGYEASNQLSVTVRKLDSAGELIDSLVTAGATNINGPSFGIAEPEKLLDKARIKALQAAQARANLYAQATGFRTARLVGISEGGSHIPPPMPMMAMREAMAPTAQSTKIEPGEVATSISLNVQYMLEP